MDSDNSEKNIWREMVVPVCTSADLEKSVSQTSRKMAEKTYLYFHSCEERFIFSPEISDLLLQWVQGYFYGIKTAGE